jgi:hypothetical protein
MPCAWYLHCIRYYKSSRIDLQHTEGLHRLCANIMPFYRRNYRKDILGPLLCRYRGVTTFSKIPLTAGVPAVCFSVALVLYWKCSSTVWAQPPPPPTRQRGRFGCLFLFRSAVFSAVTVQRKHTGNVCWVTFNDEICLRGGKEAQGGLVQEQSKREETEK